MQFIYSERKLWRRRRYPLGSYLRTARIYDHLPLSEFGTLFWVKESYALSRMISERKQWSVNDRVRRWREIHD